MIRNQFNQFTIINIDGTKYTFGNKDNALNGLGGQIEQSWIGSGTSQNDVAWKLVEITNSNETENINYKINLHTRYFSPFLSLSIFLSRLTKCRWDSAPYPASGLYFPNTNHAVPTW